MTMPLQWTGERDGEYRGTFVSAEAGAYQVTVDATRSGGQAVGTGSGSCVPVPAKRSSSIRRCTARHCAASRKRPAAGSTRPDTAKGLAEDIRYAGRGVTSVEERELWNMPIILISLMGLVCAEWGYRRLVGLA